MLFTPTVQKDITYATLYKKGNPIKRSSSLRKAMKNAGKHYASTKGFNHLSYE